MDIRELAIKIADGAYDGAVICDPDLDRYRLPPVFPSNPTTYEILERHVLVPMSPTLRGV